MLQKILTFRAGLVLLLMLTLSCPVVFARNDDRGHDRGGDRGYSRGSNRGEQYHYRNGRWYTHGWFGFDVVVSALAIGAFIDMLPPRHTTVVVEGVPYYRDDRYYYRPVLEGGYVVVPPPVIVQQPPAVIVQPPPQMMETATVNIPNSRGGFTPVTLRKSGNGYIGPQGEYYPEHPTVEQLRTLYGN